ncbi:MAG: hypothetical protein VX246_03945, partial [Myxococcota bacterium]|nr:hypothetical protein [Myxococcota bacterium]
KDEASLAQRRAGLDNQKKRERSAAATKAIAAAATKAAADAAAAAAAPQAKAPPSNKRKIPKAQLACRFYLLGKCAKDKCDFKHDRGDLERYQKAIKDGTQPMCLLEKSGKCTYGKTCLFKHAAATVVSYPVWATVAASAWEWFPSDQYIFLFDTGANVFVIPLGHALLVEVCSSVANLSVVSTSSVVKRGIMKHPIFEDRTVPCVIGFPPIFPANEATTYTHLGMTIESEEAVAVYPFIRTYGLPLVDFAAETPFLAAPSWRKTLLLDQKKDGDEDQRDEDGGEDQLDEDGDEPAPVARRLAFGADANAPTSTVVAAPCIEQPTPIDWHKCLHNAADCRHNECRVGKAAHGVRGSSVRGSARVTVEAIDADEAMMTFDFTGPLLPGLHGERMRAGSRLLKRPGQKVSPLVVVEGSSDDIPFIFDLEDDLLENRKHGCRDLVKGVYFAKCCTKESGDIIDFVHEAREHWGLEQRATVIYSDREPGIVSYAFKSYMRDCRARFVLGIPYEKNTTSYAEACMRTIGEGVASVMLGAACVRPESLILHPYATEYWACKSGVRNGQQYRTNTTPLEHWFGRLGCTATPLAGSRGQVAKKILPRTELVMYVMPDRHSAGGVYVAYLRPREDGGAGLDIAVVLERNIDWKDENAFQLTESEHDQLSQLAQCLLEPVDLRDDNDEPLGPSVPRDPHTQASVELQHRRLADALADLTAADTRELFSLPVEIMIATDDSLDDGYRQSLLEDYKLEIEHAMDLGTMKQKLEHGAYDVEDGAELFWGDAKLVARNCWKYNAPSSAMHQYGRNFGRLVDTMKRDVGKRIPNVVSQAEDAVFLAGHFDADVAPLECPEQVAAAVYDEPLPLDFDPCAAVTREVLPHEKATQVAIDARIKELSKHRKNKTWDFQAPVPGPKLPADHVCFDAHLVEVLQGTETDEARYKARFVSTNNLRTGCQMGFAKGIRCNEGDERGGDYWAPLCSLTGVRWVMFHSLFDDNVLRKGDLEAFYLQQTLGGQKDMMFVRLPKCALDLLSEEELARVQALRAQYGEHVDIWWPLTKALYGLRRAGYDAIWGLRERLVNDLGFTPTSLDPGVLSREYRVEGSNETRVAYLATYSDDLMVSARADEVTRIFQEIHEYYHFKVMEEEVDQFIGLRPNVYTDDSSKILDLCLPEYIENAATMWETFRGTVLRRYSTPIVADISAIGADGDPIQGEPLRVRQSALAKDLWRERCDRPDVAPAVSILASRTCSWDAECDEAMDRLMGYLRATKDVPLRYRVPFGLKWSDVRVEIVSDASLQVPRSRSGWCVHAVIDPSSPIQVDYPLANIAWFSGRQALAVASAIAAEWVALHTAIIRTFPIAAMTNKDSVTNAYCDNLGCVTTMPRGWAPGTSYLETMPLELLVANETESDQQIQTFSVSGATRSVELRACAIRDLIANGILAVIHRKGSQNEADGYTKVLGRVAFEEWRQRALGLHPRAQTEGEAACAGLVPSAGGGHNAGSGSGCNPPVEPRVYLLRVPSAPGAAVGTFSVKESLRPQYPDHFLLMPDVAAVNAFAHSINLLKSAAEEETAVELIQATLRRGDGERLEAILAEGPFKLAAMLLLTGNMAPSAPYVIPFRGSELRGFIAARRQVQLLVGLDARHTPTGGSADDVIVYS